MEFEDRLGKLKSPWGSKTQLIKEVIQRRLTDQLFSKAKQESRADLTPLSDSPMRTVHTMSLNNAYSPRPRPETIPALLQGTGCECQDFCRSGAWRDTWVNRGHEIAHVEPTTPLFHLDKRALLFIRSNDRYLIADRRWDRILGSTLVGARGVCLAFWNEFPPVIVQGPRAKKPNRPQTHTKTSCGLWRREDTR